MKQEFSKIQPVFPLYNDQTRHAVIKSLAGSRVKKKKKVNNNLSFTQNGLRILNYSTLRVIIYVEYGLLIFKRTLVNLKTSNSKITQNKSHLKIRNL